jgi:hypothetical protein
MRHTATPWSFDATTKPDGSPVFGSVSITDEESNTEIARTSDWFDSDGELTDDAWANAEYIVRAVNHYTALIASARDSLLRCRYDALNPCWDNRPDDVTGTHWSGLGPACPDCTLRAVLTDAENATRTKPDEANPSEEPKQLGDEYGFPFEGHKITTPWISPSGRFPSDPQEYGFVLDHTGGGCTAWGKTIDGVYYMVTDGNAEAPDSPDGGWVLGAYDDDGNPLWAKTVDADGNVTVDDDGAGETRQAGWRAERRQSDDGIGPWIYKHESTEIWKVNSFGRPRDVDGYTVIDVGHVVRDLVGRADR